MHSCLDRHDSMNPQSAAQNPVVSTQQTEALQAVMDAADLQDFDGASWMHSSLLTDPASLCKLATLISAWACVYHADMRADTLCNDQILIAQAPLETEDSSLHYQHWHDETL